MTKKIWKVTAVLLILMLVGTLLPLQASAANASTSKNPKIVFFGDSVMYGRNGAKKTDGYSPVARSVPYLIGKLLNATTYNKGVSSMGWIGLIDQTAYQKISSTKLTTYDYIVICYGTNDSSKPLGTWDSTDEKTVMGQFNKTMNYLKKKGQLGKVIIVGPWKTVKNSRIAMGRCMETAAVSWGVPFISQDDCPITSENIAEALPDGVHPDQKHYNMIAEWLAAKLKPLTKTSWAQKVCGVDLTRLNDGNGQKPEWAVYGTKKGQLLKLSTKYYKLSYKKNTRTRKITVTVTGKNGYTGQLKKTIRMTPSTSLNSVTSGQTGKMTIKWTKRGNPVAGYQIQYSTTPDFSSGNKTVKITKATTASKTITGLKAGETYYVRIRTYRINVANTHYSDWSSTQSVTIHK